MKLIALIGPHGAGKDSLIKKCLEHFNPLRPDAVQKALYITTRKRRQDEIEGRDALFTSKKNFEKMIREGQMAYYADINDYLVGTPKSELEKGDRLVINIVLPGALELKKLYKDTLLLYIDAPVEQRRQRLLSRNVGVDPGYVEFKLANYPSASQAEKDNYFDVCIDNSDGRFEASLQKLIAICVNFFKL
jgi:guanylate kinase